MAGLLVSVRATHVLSPSEDTLVTVMNHPSAQSVNVPVTVTPPGIADTSAPSMSNVPLVVQCHVQTMTICWRLF